MKKLESSEGGSSVAESLDTLEINGDLIEIILPVLRLNLRMLNI